MYDELLERLHKRIAITTAGSPLQDDLEEAADVIEDLSRENKSLAKSVNEASEILRKRWIPVTERLPGYGDKCLAVIRRDDGKQRIGISYCFVQREGFWSDKGADWEVTHWMPLPSTEGLNEA